MSGQWAGATQNRPEGHGDFSGARFFGRQFHDNCSVAAPELSLFGIADYLSMRSAQKGSDQTDGSGANLLSEKSLSIHHLLAPSAGRSPHDAEATFDTEISFRKLLSLARKSHEPKRS